MQNEVQIKPEVDALDYCQHGPRVIGSHGNTQFDIRLADLVSDALEAKIIYLDADIFDVDDDGVWIISDPNEFGKCRKNIPLSQFWDDIYHMQKDELVLAALVKLEAI